MATPDQDLLPLIRIVQQRLLEGIGHAGIIDVAFIGNTSDVYPWDPAAIADVDVCLFVERRDLALGEWLLSTASAIGSELDRAGADFELRVVRGPYKPAWRPGRPVVFAHVAVLLVSSYAQEPAAIRWAWRKYRCAIMPERMAMDAGAPPTRQALYEMIRRKLLRIRCEHIAMSEWTLPSFEERVLEFDGQHPAFAEYCLSSALVCARHHARALGAPEPDRLPNRAFVEWYGRELLHSPALEALLRLKEQAREVGFEGVLPPAKDFAVRYLEDLLSYLDAHEGEECRREPSLTPPTSAA